MIRWVAIIAVSMAVFTSCADPCAGTRIGVSSALDAARLTVGMLDEEQRGDAEQYISSAREISEVALDACDDGGIFSIAPVAKLISSVAQILRTAGVDVPEQIEVIAGMIGGIHESSSSGSCDAGVDGMQGAE